jgi:hypothetical protein
MNIDLAKRNKYRGKLTTGLERYVHQINEFAS